MQTIANKFLNPIFARYCGCNGNGSFYRGKSWSSHSKQNIRHKIILAFGINSFLLFCLATGLTLAQAGETQPPPLTLQDSSLESDFTTSLAWGDYDNDGDLDLMVGNGMLIADDIPGLAFFPQATEFLIKTDRHNRLYCNEGGTLKACWTTPDNDFTTSIAWGDMDNDGDLDLAISNVKLGVKVLNVPLLGEVRVMSDATSYLYRNLGKNLDGTPNFSRTELPVDTDSTLAMAWGDYDNDGRLDLALAKSNHYMVVDRLNRSQLAYENVDLHNRIYHNDTDVNDPNAIPTFSLDTDFQDIAEVTFNVAWIDVDADGDLDLSAVNDGTDRIYCNQKSETNRAHFQLCWSSTTEITRTLSQSWGDVDGNGYPELAVGNSDLWKGKRNFVYFNYGRKADGMLDLRNEWQSDEEDATISVAWGDADGDGDLDLVAGNGNFRTNQQSRIYCNEDGQLQTTACWSSSQRDITMSVAWGDVDGDGLLELAVGNISVPIGQQNRIYHNDGAKLDSTFSTSQSLTAGYARSIAWGDMDNDHDLDLLIAGFGKEKLYCNDHGRLRLTSAIQMVDDDSTSIAWGDMDGDHDLDIVVGNVRGEANRIYRNDGLSGECQPNFQSVLEFAANSDTSSVAWGDYDNDGDLDLAVGNGGINQLDLPVGEISQIYRNEAVDGGGKPIFRVVWESTEMEATRSVAWGDVDGDGDLDLAIGNSAKPNRLYRNDGMATPERALFTLAWSADQVDDTQSIAWADMDGDGDLDLAVGNTTQSSRVYCNENGMLSTVDCWHSLEAERTRSIAWGDMDGDGDPDLAMGNQEGANYIYQNRSGMLTRNAIWSSAPEIPGSSTPNYTLSIAWGDADGDGDLDLAAGNSAFQPSGIYLNHGRQANTASDSSPFVAIQRPGHTANAVLFSSAEIVPATDAVVISYTLFAGNEQMPVRIFPEYSTNGTGGWRPATVGNGGNGVVGLKASNWPTGTNYLFSWNAAKDIIKSDQVSFRIRTQFDQMRSPILWPALGSQSPPFRMATPWYVHVVDGRGQPVANAELYVGGDFITSTNRAGLVGPQLLVQQQGKPVVALSLQQEQLSPRRPGDWSYRTYQSTMRWQPNSQPITVPLSMTGEVRLTTTITMPLILFNLVVSLDWPADITYTQDLALAMHQASDYLFDLSDGQMAFGDVSIYTDAQQWSSADIQISAKNTVRPNSAIGGIAMSDPAAVIQLGRAWSGKNGNSGNWKEQDGYRTITHEFGHYGLHLYDEYFGYIKNPDGSLGAVIPNLSCTGGERRVQSDATNASAMDYQYTSSELSDQGLPGKLWTTDDCELTAQWLRTAQDQNVQKNESAWDTIYRVYSGPQWQIVKPSDRKGIFTGPTDIPVGLPDWPRLTISSTSSAGPTRLLTIIGPEGPMPNVGVSLYKANRSVIIDQGRTTNNGQLLIFGASTGDSLQALTLNGGLTGRVEIDESSAFTLTLGAVTHLPNIAGFLAMFDAPVSGAPYVRIIPESTHTTSEGVHLLFTASNFDPPAHTQSGLALIVSDAEGTNTRFTQANYSTTADQYIGELSFFSQPGDNQVQVIGTVNNRLYQLQSTYQLQRITNESGQSIFSNDGQLSLFINPRTFGGEATNLIITTNNTSPGPIPAGQRMLGAVYEITADGSAAILNPPAALTLGFEAELLHDDETTENIDVFWWNSVNQRWQSLNAAIDAKHNTANSLMQSLGAFVIMTKP